MKTLKTLSFALGALVLGAAAMPASAADLANGKTLVEKGNCVACHGAGMNKPISPDYPKLAGQHADYLYHALMSYQVSGNALVGRSNAIMTGQVKPLTNKDIQDIAAYLHSLPGSLVLKR